MIRFDRASRMVQVQAGESGRCLTLARVAADCSYHDQPHLIREFRSFTGLAPTRCLAGVWKRTSRRAARHLVHGHQLGTEQNPWTWNSAAVGNIAAVALTGGGARQGVNHIPIGQRASAEDVQATRIYNAYMLLRDGLAAAQKGTPLQNHIAAVLFTQYLMWTVAGFPSQMVDLSNPDAGTFGSYSGASGTENYSGSEPTNAEYSNLERVPIRCGRLAQKESRSS